MPVYQLPDGPYVGYAPSAEKVYQEQYTANSGGEAFAGSSDGTGSSASTGTRDSTSSSVADQDPGQYVLPCQYRASYVSWLGSGQFEPAVPGADASTYELDSLAVFCEMESGGHCGGYGLTDQLVGDYDHLAAVTSARLDMGGLGELGQAFAEGGSGDPGLGALENVASADDLAELGCGDSFAPTTGVLLADGVTVPIASLKPGDKVLATSTKTGKTQPETVTAVEVKRDTDLYNLKVKSGRRSEIIHTTATTCSGTLIWTTAGFRQIISNRACFSRRRTASPPSWSADRSRPTRTAGCGTSPSPATTTTTSTYPQVTLRSSSTALTAIRQLRPLVQRGQPA
jgi:hypothetical protein